MPKTAATTAKRVAKRPAKKRVAKRTRKQRPLVPCKICGKEMTSNNLARHVAAHENGTAKSSRAKAETNGSRPSGMTMGKKIADYLEACRTNSVKSGSVILGALEGFPQSTSDPEVIKAAIAEIEKRAAAETNILKEVRLHQRVLDLHEGLGSLGGDAGEGFFIKWGAEWAKAQRFPISYAAFRHIGVPAAVLKEAGIK